MSDEHKAPDRAPDTPPRKQKRRIVHTSDNRRPLAERVDAMEIHIKTIFDQLPEMIGSGVNEAAKQIVNVLGAHLSQEHARVFEVQEAAFMAMAEQFDFRIKLLEDREGLAFTPLASMRDTVEAIADYFGAVAESEGRMPLWAVLTADQRADVVQVYITERKPQMVADARAEADAHAAAAAKAAETNNDVPKIEIVRS